MVITQSKQTTMDSESKCSNEHVKTIKKYI